MPKNTQHKTSFLRMSFGTGIKSRETVGGCARSELAIHSAGMALAQLNLKFISWRGVKTA
jgi:hypothetical protein